MKKFLRNRDIFSQRLEISDEHGTPLGGVFSLLLRFGMAYYIYTLFVTMLTHDDDKTYLFKYNIS